MRRAAVLMLVVVASARAAIAAQPDVREAGSEGGPREYSNSLLGLSVTYQDWDEDRPWAKRNPDHRSASGILVEGGYILTTAQMIDAAAFIQVEKFGRTTRFSPRVVHVDREIDLALLRVDDPEFGAELRAARLAQRTPDRGVLRTVRWRNQQLESVASRIKRLEVQRAFRSQLEHVFLLVETDMSGGGWAEPVFEGDRLVGITDSQSEQGGRVIPVEIIAAYLDRVRSGGTYQGSPVLGVKWQVNRDPALAAFLGQTAPPHGALIRQVPWGSSACGVLKPRDILLSIDGHAIDAEGYYTHPGLGRLALENIVIDGHEVGDVVPVRVLRQEREMDLEMTLRGYPAALDLVPGRRDGPPPYVVAGGLVFRELDVDYLRSWGSDWVQNAPLVLVTRYFLRQEGQEPSRRRVVLLSSVLPSSYVVGYETLRDLPVESINGRPIDSIPDVLEAFRSPEGRFHTIVFERSSERREIVLDAPTLEAATAEVLATYGVPEAYRMPASPPPAAGPECPGDY